MSETQNYQLYLEDNDKELFLNWRQKMNGPNESNMVKIDRVLSEKADKSRDVSVSLLAAGWAGEAAPFQQNISVAGLTSDQNGSIAVSPSATPQEFEAACDGLLTIVGQRENELTIAARGDKPAVDIPVVVTLLG